MIKRLPQHGQRIEKKVTDFIADVERADAELAEMGVKFEPQREVLKNIKESFETVEMKANIQILKSFNNLMNSKK